MSEYLLKPNIKAVMSVSATAPVVSSGGQAPIISIPAATASENGYMTTTQVSKLNGITAGAAVSSVSGTAPIVSSGGTTPAISISAATTSAAGSMSAADKSKLDIAWTSSNDGSGTGLDADLLDGVHASSLRVYDGWVGNPGIDADAMTSNKVGFTYSTNAPYTGPIVNFGGGEYTLQINSPYGSSGSLSFRTRNGDTHAWNNWQTLSTTSHTHSAYSTTDHTHSSYSLTSHTHSSYSLTSHTHSDYSDIYHDHELINNGDNYIAVLDDGKFKTTCVIPEYWDNAAAKAASLINGTLYRTGDFLKIVHA